MNKNKTGGVLKTPSLEKEKWSTFVLNHSHGNIFQSPEFFEACENYEKYEPVIITIKENGELAGVLQAIVQKEKKGFWGRFTARSIIWGAPLVKDNNLNLLSKILQKYNSKIKNKAIYSQFRNLWSLSEDEKQVFLNNGFLYEDHLDIIHDLSLSVDNQFMKMHKGRRKNIRRAEKAGLNFKEVSAPSDLEKCIALIEDTYERVKLPVPDRDFFRKSFICLGLDGYLKVFAAFLNNKVIGTRMVFCYKDLIYDWYAGADERHLDKYPNDYLPWKIMEWGSNEGYGYFDFGGAGKPGVPYGVREYKLKFGGELVDYGRFQTVHKPLLMQLGKIGFKVYKKMK
ncbi:lipid II:glycine glycyltransferase FemX [Desulfotignum balticum]|uniref:lipid II:glycine glycyltransferase FemX n=1 Tax=Desulfotignum balticum TaxID=115781 RepID=UPI00041D9323|nr:GNAT family N-acetyltransferase [Desulfotignum balticum]